jgi:hypothetical protein
MPKNVAVLCRVSGYRRGEFFPEIWYAVYDGRGNVFSGSTRDTAAAVQIRYCDKFGVPDDWDACTMILNPAQFDHTAGVCELLHAIAAQRAREGRRPSARGAPIVPRRARVSA